MSDGFGRHDQLFWGCRDGKVPSLPGAELDVESRRPNSGAELARCRAGADLVRCRVCWVPSWWVPSLLGAEVTGKGETGQLVPWTTRTLDDSYLLLSDVVPTRTRTNSYLGRLEPSV